MTPKPPHSLDTALTAYFRAQMPEPFPPAPSTPLATPARRAAASGGSRSRWVLAFSAAGLLGLGLVLSAGRTAGERAVKRAPAGPDYLNGSSAQMKGPMGEVLKSKP